MKLSFLSENIQKKLSIVNHAVSLKSQLPILLNFLLEARNSSLIISSTDLEIGLKINIPAKVEKEGKTTVLAKNFLELINSLPSEKIKVEQDGNNLIVASDKTRTVFQTTPADDFPRLYEEKGKKIAVLKNEEIQKIFPPVVFAASLDIGRPALSGILIQPEKEVVSFVATDGFRLSLKKQKKEEVIKKEDGEPLLIPARLIRELILIAQEGGEVEVYLSKEKNQILFSKPEMVLVGRLIDAQFPAYEKIIPQDWETKAVFDKDEMQRAVKICSIFARETANIVRLSFKEDKIIVSANTPSIGQNTVEVEATLSGEENEIAFNARYLLDLFGTLSENDIVFEMTGPLNPGVFKIQNDDSFLHLIMPIRVQG